jgi:hypothetical protein
MYLTAADTEEGLRYPVAVAYYARIRLIVNLLPLLRRATDLRRVVSVFTATKEGRIDTNDFDGRHVPLLSQRGHISSIMTLALEAIANDAPEVSSNRNLCTLSEARYLTNSVVGVDDDQVSFIHDFPGAVKTNLGKDVKEMPMVVLTTVFRVIAPLVTMPFDEAGERQLFFATSARFPPRAPAAAGKGSGAAAGVPLAPGVEIARGTDGNPGSGVYSISMEGESAKPKVEQLLAEYRKNGTLQKVWKHTEGEFTRVTGAASV